MDDVLGARPGLGASAPRPQDRSGPEHRPDVDPKPGADGQFAPSAQDGLFGDGATAVPHTLAELRELASQGAMT